MDELLKNLNEPQVEAVRHTEGPLLVLAGAGSGKTRMLTHRIAYLISQKNLAPANILAVTFTNKAAGEMRARVLKLLGKTGYERSFLPFLGTFHAVSVRILRQEAATLGYNSSFVIFDTGDSTAAIKQAMRSIGIDEKQYNPNLIKNLISSAKNELVGPSSYATLASGPAQEAAAKIYPLYQKLMREAQALDFDDLLLETVRMFQKYPEILEKWQRQFHYILIDEYQDTNNAQYQFAKLLAAAQHNICVVGDDWQSIYSWRGANFRNILEFERDYPETKVIKLEQNYRSSTQILDAAQSIITKNQQRSDKKLWTAKTVGAPVLVHPVPSDFYEAEVMVRTVQEAVAAGRRKLGDFAVLYRTNAQSRSIEEAFVSAGVPYKIIGGVRFYERKEIKDVLAYLRFIYQPQDVLSWRRIINLPPRGLGEKSLQTLQGWQAQSNLSLLEALKQLDRIAGLTPRARAAFSNFRSLIEKLSPNLERLSVPELIELIVKRSGYLDYLNDGSLLAADRLENVQELIGVAGEYKQSGGDGVATFLEDVALLSDVDEYNEQSDAVTLMTVHAAKGLEFPVVFLVGLEEGVFPHTRALADPEQLEEERRLMYVGVTRAMEELHLIHAASRLLYGRIMHNPPARFIAEIEEFSQTVASFGASFDQTIAQIAIPELQSGDKVLHPSFGEGTVLDVIDDEITVAFGQIQKRLNRLYAPLQKA